MTTVRTLPLNRLKASGLNPRGEFLEEPLAELAESIRLVGVVEPLVVRPRGKVFEIIAGERRFRAARLAGLQSVPCIVRALKDQEVLQLNLVENLHRQELTDLEKGRACLRLMKDFPQQFPTVTTIARRVSRPRRTVAQWVQLASEVSRPLQKLVGAARVAGDSLPKGRISADIALAITRNVKDPKNQIKVAKALAARRLPSSEARKVVKRVGQSPDRAVDRVLGKALTSPPELPFRLVHVEAIKTGTKTQTTRKGLPSPRIRPGALVYASALEPRILKLRIKSVERKRLREFDARDAQREGGYSLNEFKRVWKTIHGEGWKPDQQVYVIQFEKA